MGNIPSCHWEILSRNLVFCRWRSGGPQGLVKDVSYPLGKGELHFFVVQNEIDVAHGQTGCSNINIHYLTYAPFPFSAVLKEHMRVAFMCGTSPLTPYHPPRQRLLATTSLFKLLGVPLCCLSIFSTLPYSPLVWRWRREISRINSTMGMMFIIL